MAGDAAGEGELTEQLSQSFGIFTDTAVDLGVSAFQVGVGHQSGAAVTGPGDIDDVGVAVADDPVQMRIDRG